MPITSISSSDIPGVLGLPSNTVITSSDPVLVVDETMFGFQGSSKNPFIILAAELDTKEGEVLLDASEEFTPTLSFAIPNTSWVNGVSFDYMFIVDEPVGSGIDEDEEQSEFISVLINGNEVFTDSSGTPLIIEGMKGDVFIPGEPFDSLDALTRPMRFRAKPEDFQQDNTETLELAIKITDDDEIPSIASALFINNIRLLPQLVFLDFKGGSVLFEENLFLENIPGIDVSKELSLPAPNLDDNTKLLILEQVQSIFKDFNIEFVLDAPEEREGYYSTILIGDGTESDLFPVKDFLNDIFKGEDLSTLGLADAVDVGNTNPSDNAVVYLGEPYFFEDGKLIVERLSQVIAHEAAHLLGLGHTLLLLKIF